MFNTEVWLTVYVVMFLSKSIALRYLMATDVINIMIIVILLYWMKDKDVKVQKNYWKDHRKYKVKMFVDD